MIEIKKDKNVYAAYSNMAQHNFFMIMEKILKTLGVNYNPKNDMSVNVVNVLKSKNVVDKAKAVDLLNRHFPFLVPMKDTVINLEKASNTVEAYRFLIPKIRNVINFYRNNTTHFDHPDGEKEVYDLNLDERNLVPCLKDLFKAGLRTVQQRFGYEERDMSFIKNKEMGKVNFKYSLFKKELISNLDAKPTEVFSIRGLLFFFSLFLEKKYINEFLAKTKAFYTYEDLNSSKRRKIIFEALSVYRAKLPRKRYDSEEDKTTLALDMVNELQRCPKELFDLLSKNDQELFRSEERSDDDMNTALMLRHGDRFPVLALKYIDTMEVFKQIRFQVNLGKYRFAFYDKKCIDANDGEQTNHVRSLEKELHGFGRLKEIEEARTTEWASLIREFEDIEQDTADSTPYITDHHASYLINNNRIGMYWKASKEDPKPGLPKLNDTPQAKDLLQKRRDGEKVATLTPPKCFMSTHELPSLMFLHLLMKDMDSQTIKELGVQDPEAIIRNWVTGFRKFVSGFLTGEITKENAPQKAAELGIDYPKQLPKKLLEAIGTKEHDKEKMKRKLQVRLQKHIDETAFLLEKIKERMVAVEDKRNRRGTKKFVEIKPGRLASWLAHDIIALQPTPSDGNKMTGLNFQILQSSLAIYNDFDSLKRILVGAHLIIHKDAHPFLMDVVKVEPQSTAAFYKKYLEEKIRWLHIIAEKDLSKYAFLTRGVNKWSERNEHFYNKVLESYVTLPAELPRGLFSEHIKTVLAHKMGKDFVKGDNRDEANITFLIAKYLKKALNDDNQEFYTQPGGMYKRYYTFFKTLQQFSYKTLEYGKTVAQMDNFLRNDTSLHLLGFSSQEADVDTDLLLKGKEEIEIKLAKALAKNPNLDKEQRIRDIIKSSNKLRSLSQSQQNALLRHCIKGMSGAGDKGAIKDYLAHFDSKEDQAREKEFLARNLRHMKATERQIRRIKVQDIIVFLMARNILFGSDSELLNNRFADFKLKNIRPIRRQDGISALEIKIPFSITLKIKGSNVPVRISQDSIKLKNYGDFMRFLYDSRIETLIPYLVDGTEAVRIDITRDDLEAEFESYDRERLEVFANVHKIEQMILERHRELKDKNSPHFYYYDENGELKAKRGNFNKLLEYSHILEDSDSAEAVNIRNAFSHNSYKGQGKYKGKVLEQIDIPTKSIGDIAPTLGKILENKTEKVKKQNKKSE